MPTTYSSTNGQVVLTGDLALSSLDAINWIGASSAHVTVIGNGFRIKIPDASFIGQIKMAYCDLFDVGSSITEMIGGTNLGDYAFLGSTSYADIQHCTFNRCGTFNFLTGGTSYIKFNYNTYSTSNLVPCHPDDAVSTASREWFFEQGTSTSAKEMKGNRIFVSWARLTSPNWTVGAASTAVNSTEIDRDGNLCAGKRVGFRIDGPQSIYRYNYTHVDLGVDAQQQTTSQNYNLQTLSSGSIAEHNVIHAGHWVTNGINGTLRYNVICLQSPHNLTRIGTGTVNNNIYFGHNPGLDRYTDTARIPHGDATFGLFQTTDRLAFDHNTMDERGTAVKALLWVSSNGAQSQGYTNNVAYQLTLVNSTGAGGCAVGPYSDAIASAYYPGASSEVTGLITSMDYNDVYFMSTSPKKIVYGIKPTGSTFGDTNAGLHDLGTFNGQGLNPSFKGPLTIGSGQTGTGGSPVVSSNCDSGFPFNDRDIFDGVYTVRDMLDYFRWIYAPQSTSPLINAGSDGQHIGAVASTSIPSSSPVVASANKRPMVHAGRSFTVTGSTTAKLSGYGADDGRPSSNLTFQWAVVNKPAGSSVAFGASFGASTTALTDATFSSTGTYTLRLTASDSTQNSWHDVQIRIA